MDASTAAGGGGAGPAPFLLKTYEMVDDTATDAIVSWTRSGKSFVVWNPPEFSRILLPSYFKHNNFSSFIRQLNTYGFRKIDPEKWEFSNEDFVKDHKHLLKNIHRRKPIHSHSQPQGSVDPERAAFEEEIDKLSREKTVLEEQLMGFKDQQSAAKAQLENLTLLVGSIEQRQERFLSYLEKSVQNPEFVERLVQKLESMDFSAYNKKRRLPAADNVESGQDNALGSKLRLELSPAASNANLLSHSTESSNEDRVSPQGRINGCSSKEIPTGLLSQETVDLSDTGASFNLAMDSSLSCKVGPETQNDEHVSCLLNLSLASSSPLEHNKSPTTLNSNNVEDGHRADDGVDHNKQGPNDVFWEQFLTERPGCSDTEEASSSFRGNQSEDGKSMKGMARNTEGMEHLTL